MAVSDIPGRATSSSGAAAASRSYAVVTPARDEARNLPRLARCLAMQTQRPAAWIVVDNGSEDKTLAVAHDLAAVHPWMDVISVHGEAVMMRGAPIARAVHAGIAALGDAEPDVFVITDADVSMPPSYFERLLEAFDTEPALGMASGSRHERTRGVWRQQHITGTSVEGQCRAYRWECLQEVLPLEERMCWDGIDEIKANVLGWKTRTLLDLPFRHHREIGARERRPSRAWAIDGDAAWYMGYRPYYLVLGSFHHTRRDARALAMILGYGLAVVRRKPRHPDPNVRSYVRRQQSIRNLPQRLNEALGRGRGRRARPR